MILTAISLENYCENKTSKIILFKMTNENPLVSIIVITYNSSKYVLETLESAKVQTYQNIELIISDDCSTDNTIDICRNWIEENKERFVRTELVIAEKNSGIPANFNRGLKTAKGEWFKLIAGDDILNQNCISDYISYVNSSPAEIYLISSEVELINECNEPIESEPIINNEILLFQKYFFNIGQKKQLKEYARNPLFLYTPAFFVHNSVYKKINFNDETFFKHEDLTFTFRALENGFKYYFLASKTVKYRIHSEGISKSTDPKKKEMTISERKRIFWCYQKKHLNVYNIIDLSVFYETWLHYYYNGTYGFKGVSYLRLFSLNTLRLRIWFPIMNFIKKNLKNKYAL